MPRLNNSDELFKRLTRLEIYTPATSSPGTTSTSANATAGATALVVAAITNFSDNDYLFINGDGGFELNQVDGAPAGSSIPLEFTLGKAQSSGATVVEATQAIVQRIAQDGLGFSPSFTQEPIFSADAAGAIGYFEGQGEFALSFGLLGFNGPNLLLAVGAPVSLETGTGTTGDPYQTHIATTDFNTVGSLAIRAVGTRYNGGTFHVDFNDVRIEAAGEARMARGRELIIPVQAKFTRYAFRHPV